MEEIERKFLLPGEFFATKKPMMLGTLLGSCVSICLHNTKQKFAAMNHFVLPTSGNIERAMSEEPGKYGLSSCNRIINALMKIDPVNSHFVAQVFGGGNVNGHLALQGGTVGKRNIEMADRILDERSIRVIRREVGGDHGRKLHFDTFNNTVDCRLIKQSAAVDKLRRDREDLSKRDIRVLIVDDSPTVRGVLRKAIEASRGISVVAEAGDPYEARDQVLTHDPDVILLDIIMPRMNGLDFLKKLSKYLPKPVVIVSTIAKAGSDIARRASAYGATEVIDKEKLELYKGLDVVKAELIPKIRGALIKFKPPTRA